jgi:hypothetical protein
VAVGCGAGVAVAGARAGTTGAGAGSSLQAAAPTSASTAASVRTYVLRCPPREWGERVKRVQQLVIMTLSDEEADELPPGPAVLDRLQSAALIGLLRAGTADRLPATLGSTRSVPSPHGSDAA